MLMSERRPAAALAAVDAVSWTGRSKQLSQSPHHSANAPAGQPVYAAVPRNATSGSAAVRRSSAGELERPANQPFHSRSFCIGRRSQGDESRVLSAALKQPTPVVELAAAVEEHGRVVCECSDPDHVCAFDGVADELPHRRFRTWSLTPVDDLVGFGGGCLHSPDGGLHSGAQGRRHLQEVLGQGALRDWS